MSKNCTNKSKYANNPNYICNPKSGRWVKKTGVIGKNLLSSKQKNMNNDVASVITDKIMKYSDITKKELDEKKLQKYVATAIKKGVNFNKEVHMDMTDQKLPLWEALILHGHANPIWFELSEESKNLFTQNQRDLIDDVNEYIGTTLKSVVYDYD